MNNEDIKIIGGGLFSTEIEVEINDEITPPSRYDLDIIAKNKEHIEYLKTNYNMSWSFVGQLILWSYGLYMSLLRFELDTLSKECVIKIIMPYSGEYVIFLSWG